MKCVKKSDSISLKVTTLDQLSLMKELDRIAEIENRTRTGQIFTAIDVYVEAYLQNEREHNQQRVRQKESCIPISLCEPATKANKKTGKQMALKERLSMDKGEE